MDLNVLILLYTMVLYFVYRVLAYYMIYHYMHIHKDQPTDENGLWICCTIRSSAGIGARPPWILPAARGV